MKKNKVLLLTAFLLIGHYCLALTVSGFVYVDKNNDGTGTLKRYKKKSFDWYKKVIETNGIDLDI